MPQTTHSINEFTSNDENFYGTFSTPFPLRCGLCKPGSIPKAGAVHMLNQHSGIFGNSAALIFIMFNQTQRHAVVKALAGRVKSGQRNFNAFSNIVNADNFQAQCNAAALEPNGPVAWSLLCDIFPMVWFSGEPVPFGPAVHA